MAVVDKGIDPDTGTIVAIKKVATEGTQVDEAALRREIDIYDRLKQIPIQHILAVRDIFREGSTYAPVTEFADGGLPSDAPKKIRRVSARRDRLPPGFRRLDQG